MDDPSCLSRFMDVFDRLRKKREKDQVRPDIHNDPEKTKPTKRSEVKFGNDSIYNRSQM